MPNNLTTPAQITLVVLFIIHTIANVALHGPIGIVETAFGLTVLILCVGYPVAYIVTRFQKEKPHDLLSHAIIYTAIVDLLSSIGVLLFIRASLT